MIELIKEELFFLLGYFWFLLLLIFIGFLLNLYLWLVKLEGFILREELDSVFRDFMESIIFLFNLKMGLNFMYVEELLCRLLLFLWFLFVFLFVFRLEIIDIGLIFDFWRRLIILLVLILEIFIFLIILSFWFLGIFLIWLMLVIFIRLEFFLLVRSFLEFRSFILEFSMKGCISFIVILYEEFFCIVLLLIIFCVFFIVILYEFVFV